MKEIINRKQITDLLTGWRSGELSEVQVHEWAESKYQNDNVNYSDWENGGSATNEVLAALDVMDMNLMTKEDIQYYLDFLDTPAGRLTEGLKKLEDDLKIINFKERKRELRTNPFYENFCR